MIIKEKKGFGKSLIGRSIKSKIGKWIGCGYAGLAMHFFFEYCISVQETFMTVLKKCDLILA